MKYLDAIQTILVYFLIPNKWDVYNIFSNTFKFLVKFIIMNR